MYLTKKIDQSITNESRIDENLEENEFNHEENRMNGIKKKGGIR